MFWFPIAFANNSISTSRLIILSPLENPVFADLLATAKAVVALISIRKNCTF